MNRRALLADWAQLLIESLADAGVRDMVISPGSRSTPLVWAALACPRVECRSIVDERDAAFWAVGAGKCSGRPVGLICTSGSAAANYFPAIVEASLSHTPLVVLTADRPFELMHAGAPQTIDQTKMYGDYVRHFVELGSPEGSRTALVALRRTAAQLVRIATGVHPGPVHANVRTHKPLEPPEPEAGRTEDAGRILAQPLPQAEASTRRVGDDAVARFARMARDARRPLIVLGPIAPADRIEPNLLLTFARRLGAPIFAEATSNARFGMPHGHAHLDVDGLGTLFGTRGARSALAPDFVVQIGATPTSAAYAALLDEQPSLERVVVAPHGWPDPQGTAREMILGDLSPCLHALSGALAEPSGQPLPYAQRLAVENRRAWQVVDEALEELPFGEAHAVRTVVDSLESGSLLALGNSLPVREVDRVGKSVGKDVIVWSQRGASGIDGLVAGAAGAAAASERPTTLLLGDVSLLHDLGGLAVAAASAVPLRIVVIHNGGGRIFDQLPIGRRRDIPRDGRAFWTTPHERTFSGSAGQFGIAYAQATGREQTERALSEARGVSLIELRVGPDSAREFAEHVTRRIDALSFEDLS